jgi:hypothetical protein
LRPLRIAGLGLVFGLAGWAAAAPMSAASPGPTLTVTPAAASVGSTVVVQGQGFPPQVYNLQVAVCGNLGLNGSADCNQTSARTTFTGDGTFALNLPVAMPPTPCPCAILAFAPAIPDPVTVPFTVIGAPVATPAAPPPAFEQKTLQVENAKLEGSGDWQSWFGAATTRDLVFTIHNSGTTPVDDPPLVLAAGKGNNPEGVVTPPRVGHIEPGARRTVRAAVPIDTFSVGSYTVKGTIGNTGAAETFRAHTTIYPWGLFALAILVPLALLLWIFNGVRRRVAARKARKRAARAPESTADLATASPDDEDWEDEDQYDDEWAEDDEWADDEWTDDQERTSEVESEPIDIHWR